MKSLDDHLQQIQEDTIQEIEPITTVALGVATIAVLSNFIMLLFGSSGIINAVKVDKSLSKRINEILKSGNKWIVHIYPTKEPNAFSLGFGKHIFVTTKLTELLNDDEVVAVLLHEAYHSSKKHTPKQLAYKYPLYYLVALLGSTLLTSTALIPLAILAMFIAHNVGDIVYDITIGRKMEYNADSFASKQGYGKQLISAFSKMEKWAISTIKKKPCGRWCKIINKIDKAIDEHPDDRKRVENILRHTTELGKVLKTKSFGKIKGFVIKMWGK